MAQKIVNIEGVGQLAFPDTMTDEAIKAVIERDFGPKSKEPPTVIDQVKNSPVGGFVRGLRDLPDAGAQLLTRGLEAIAPAGSDFEKYMTAERQRVEAINRTAEADYQQNWRRGKMGDSLDTGRVVGNVAASIPIAAAAPIQAGMTLPQIALRGAVQGAGSAALTQPVQNPGDSYFSQKATQAGVGAGLGAGGAVVGSMLGEAVQGSARANRAGSNLGGVGPDPTNILTTPQKALIKRGQNIGLQATPGQASGSRALQQMEARMESNPLFSGPFNSIKQGNQKAINRAVAQGIGEASDVVDSAVLAKAETRLGSVFDKVAESVPKATIDKGLATNIGQIEADINGVSDKALLDNPLVKRFVNIVSKGEASGAELRSLSSKLGRAAKSNMKADYEFGTALFNVKDLVDNIIADNLDDATRQAFDKARGEYRNLVTVLSRQNVVNPSSGNVSGVNLASALMSRDKSGFTMGRNTSPMYDAARFSQAFKPLVNDSGTATRSMQMGPTDFVVSLPTNILSSLYASGPTTSLAASLGQGVLRNPTGDALAELLRRAGPTAGTSLGFQGLLNQPYGE